MTVVSVDMPQNVVKNFDTSKVIAFEDIYTYQEVDVEYDVNMSGTQFLDELKDNNLVSQ